MANNQQILDSFSRLALFENYLLPHIFGVNVLKAHHFDTTKRKIKIKIINEKKNIINTIQGDQIREFHHNRGDNKYVQTFTGV